MTESHISFTVSFSEKGYYIMRKILDATKEEPEDYIRGCVLSMFSSDIDLNYGPEHHKRKELHILNDSDEPLIT